MSTITLSNEDPGYSARAIEWCSHNVANFRVHTLWPVKKLIIDIADEKEAINFVLKWIK